MNTVTLTKAQYLELLQRVKSRYEAFRAMRADEIKAFKSDAVMLKSKLKLLGEQYLTDAYRRDYESEITLYRLLKPTIQYVTYELETPIQPSWFGKLLGGKPTTTGVREVVVPPMTPGEEYASVITYGIAKEGNDNWDDWFTEYTAFEAPETELWQVWKRHNDEYELTSRCYELFHCGFDYAVKSDECLFNEWIGWVDQIARTIDSVSVVDDATFNIPRSEYETTSQHLLLKLDGSKAPKFNQSVTCVDYAGIDF